MLEGLIELYSDYIENAIIEINHSTFSKCTEKDNLWILLLIQLIL